MSTASELQDIPPTIGEVMTFIEQSDTKSANEAREMAWMYIRTARALEPGKYETDAKWVRHFIDRAKEYWSSYKFYRKAAGQ